MINREEVLKVIAERGQSPNIVKHLIAVGGAMRSLATHFGENADEWEVAGIIHDADYNLAPLDRHGYAATEWFQGQLTPEQERAVISHNFKLNAVAPEGKMGWSLYAVDNLAGLIVAATLVLPDKKLSSLTKASVLKRFREPSFAKGADREEVQSCREVGLSLEEFVSISLPGIQALADQLGL